MEGLGSPSTADLTKIQLPATRIRRCGRVGLGPPRGPPPLFLSHKRIGRPTAVDTLGNTCPSPATPGRMGRLLPRTSSERGAMVPICSQIPRLQLHWITLAAQKRLNPNLPGCYRMPIFLKFSRSASSIAYEFHLFYIAVAGAFTKRSQSAVKSIGHGTYVEPRGIDPVSVLDREASIGLKLRRHSGRALRLACIQNDTRLGTRETRLRSRPNVFSLTSRQDRMRGEGRR